MSAFSALAFSGIGREIFLVAWIAFAILVAALLAAAAYVFFASSPTYDSDLRAATMDLSPTERRRFFELYDTRHPKDPAIAWFLAVAFGPIGANLYRGKRAALFGAIVSLNGFGAWWLESWFTTPQLVLMENRAAIAWARDIMAAEERRSALREPMRRTA